MKKMISNLMGAVAIGTALFVAQPVAAQCCPPDPCCSPCDGWCDMCGDWEIGAHALYWTPVACQYVFAIQRPSVVTLEPEDIGTSAVKCDADWGFRVFGRYVSDCSFLGLGYQWFESKVGASRTGENLTTPGNAVVGQLSRVEGRTRLEYQNVDVKLGKYLHRSCGCNFYLFGNARWVDLSYRRALRHVESINGNVETITEKSELQGGALGVGLGADYDLWCDFGIFGDANLLGVIAERSTRNVRSIDFTGTPTQVSYGSDTCINPEVNFRIGVNYRYTCGCWTVVGEIGYEVDYFWDAVAFPRLPNPASDLTNSSFGLQCENIGFSGLFFGGRLLF